MILIAGHHGSGKTTLLHLFGNAGYFCFESSTILREIYSQSNTTKDLWDWVIDIRSTHGSGYLSRRITDSVRHVMENENLTDTSRVVISGMRGPFIKDYLRDLLHSKDRLIVIWIDVRPHILYARYIDRLGRDGQAPISEQNFRDLLMREEEYGLDIGLIKPDVTLDNNGAINKFRLQFTNFISDYRSGYYHAS